MLNTRNRSSHSFRFVDPSGSDRAGSASLEGVGIERRILSRYDGGRERGRRAMTSAGNVSILGRSRGLPASRAREREKEREREITGVQK